jgi:nicotinamide phosphoribosyltransferase
MTNLILNTDSYKASHFLQYPPRTELINSYIEARGVSNDFVFVNSTVFFGLQMFIKKHLQVPITMKDLREARDICAMHGVPFNEQGWEYIINEHGGYLPIRIWAIPEGSVTPIGTALVQVQNYDKKVPWITSYIETALIRSVWYPTTVATLSRYVKSIMKEFLDATSDNPEHLDFMLHDFGARGVSSEESAEIGGLAHLVNFKGTDTMSALVAARHYYHESMAGFSIPAAEHSTITAWGKEEEKAAYENMIDQFGKGLYAVVSDSYDIYNAVDNIWGKELKDKVIEKGGRLVIRPDSGEPVEVVLEVLHSLRHSFGVSHNSKGYMVLHPSVRVIQGDGVNPWSIREILTEMKKHGYAADNVVFGMGGALLQKVNRDSLKFAMKASAIRKEDDKEWQDVYKDPVTDSGKVSKRGVQSVVIQNGVWKTVPQKKMIEPDYITLPDQLRLVYVGGQIVNDERFSKIRERANVS